MEILKEINKWVQDGFEITYDIVNQIENGYEDEVISGDMPKFSYTFYIHRGGKELWLHSVDSLTEGYAMVLEWLKNSCKISR